MVDSGQCFVPILCSTLSKLVQAGTTSLTQAPPGGRRPEGTLQTAGGTSLS
jgi:hypothetical protein